MAYLHQSADPACPACRAGHCRAEASEAVLSTHTVEGTIRWDIGRPTEHQCACCVGTPGLEPHRHIYGYTVDLPADTPDAAFHADERPNLREWLYQIYSRKREVPDGARIRVTVEILPPEGES